MNSMVTHKIANSRRRSRWAQVLVVLLAGIFLLGTSSCPVLGQEPPKIDESSRGSIIMYDVNGHPIVNSAAEPKGSPLFLPTWKLGWLRLADNQFFPGVALELDLERQKVYYKRDDGSIIQVESGQVKALAIRDTVAGATVAYQFVCGYQPIDNQSETSFYLLLDSGRITFLESMRKRYYQEKDELGGNDQREYRTYNDFYVFYQGKITRIKKDIKFFQELTSDKHDQMADYLKKNNVSFRSDEDVRQFIHYYNGLP
jgi:hypothetical protein